MQTIGPYRLLQALGTCQVGGVWSAVDASDQRVTMAVLSANAARDPKARTDFATVANELARSGQVPVIGGDFSAPTPWVASSAVDGSVVAQIFVAMGAVYHPLVAEPDGWQVPEQATVVLTQDQSEQKAPASESATTDQPAQAGPDSESAATAPSYSEAATQLLPIHSPPSGDASNPEQPASSAPGDPSPATAPVGPDSPESVANSEQTTTVLSFGQTGAAGPVSPPAGPAQVSPAAASSPGWDAPPPVPVPPQPEPTSVPPPPTPSPVAAPFSPAATSEVGYAEQAPLTPPPPPPPPPAPQPPVDQVPPAFPVAPVSPPQQWGAPEVPFPPAPPAVAPQYGQALPQVYQGPVAQGQLVPAQPPISSPPVSPYAAWEYPPPPVSGSGPGASAGQPAPGAGRGRRTVLLVVIGVLALVLIGGAATAGALLLREDSDPTAQPSPSPTPEQPTPPREPGIEPPQDGAWPEDWPRFGPGDGAQRMENLPGIGFSFEVPAGWQCTDAGSTPDEAHYTCGVPGGDPQVGGDLIVRACPEPCDSERRVEMRRAEEAWGVQWIRDGGYLSWAETTADIAGEEYYRVVFVGYYRSSEEGRIDRQVVFRMTALAEDRDDLRKTANSVRSGFR